MGALGSCKADVPTSPFPPPPAMLMELVVRLCLVCCYEPPLKYLPVIPQTCVEFAGPLKELGGDA